MISVFYFGYRLSYQSGNKKVVIALNPLSPKRGLAGAEKLSLRVLSTNQQQNLIKNAVVEQTGETTTFYLGHFMVQSHDNFILACQKYQKINMVFIAPAISVHGHVPEMHIRSDCMEARGSSSRIGPFIIPKKQIRETSIRDQNLFNSTTSVILFNHISLRRPKRWVLKELTLKNERENEQTVIDMSINKEQDSFSIDL